MFARTVKDSLTGRRRNKEPWGQDRLALVAFEPPCWSPCPPGGRGAGIHGGAGRIPRRPGFTDDDRLDHLIRIAFGLEAPGQILQEVLPCAGFGIQSAQELLQLGLGFRDELLDQLIGVAAVDRNDGL